MYFLPAGLLCLAELARLSLEPGLWLGPGRARSREAHNPSLPRCQHQGRPCSSPSSACAGKKSTKLAKTIGVAAGNVRKAGPALACWAVPVLSHGGHLILCPGSSAAPCRPGMQLSSCSPWREAGLCPSPAQALSPKTLGCPRALELQAHSLQQSSPRVRHRG